MVFVYENIQIMRKKLKAQTPEIFDKSLFGQNSNSGFWFQDEIAI